MKENGVRHVRMTSQKPQSGMCMRGKIIKLSPKYWGKSKIKIAKM